MISVRIVSATFMAAAAPLGFGSVDPGSVDLGSVGPGSTGAALEIHYVNTQTVADDLEYGGYKVGGLSGIDYAPDLNTYAAISDNRGEAGPVRMYTLTLPVDPTGTLGAPRFDSLVQLADTDGKPYVPRASDTESVRWTPDRKGFVYTSEGEAKIGRPGFIRQATADGRFVADFPVPDAYTPRLDQDGKPASGIRDNLGFEAMDLSRDGSTIVAVSENALVQDGPAASVDGESPARLVEIDRRTGADLGEYVYPVDRVAPGAMPVATGVAEIVSVDDHTFLALERSLIPGVGFTGKIYETSTRGADNVAGAAAITGTERKMTKRLVFDFGSLGMDPQCVEGMTWGPRLPSGDRSLVLVSDNNFGLAGRTSFHLLAVAGG
ncbi:esterase-like activity of phytase family protein [Rhodococcus sp. NPDC127528]|uniref:esterase-like activity of phytase family protein n=1 Tax=unclassified Rhodococcus (in: high G+C Gram-positive bacteria) TaxID=192944 RepID=UPI003635CB94